MIVICAWCQEVVEEKEPFELQEISHTICQECSFTFLEEEKNHGKISQNK